MCRKRSFTTHADLSSLAADSDRRPGNRETWLPVPSPIAVRNAGTIDATINQIVSELCGHLDWPRDHAMRVTSWNCFCGDVSRRLHWLGLLASIVACSGSPTAPTPSLPTNTEPTPLHLTIDFPARAFDVGETGQFRANLAMSDGTTREDVEAEWQLSNTTVATVSDTGVVTARRPGAFDLRATAEELTARLTGLYVATPVDSRFDDTFWRQMVYNNFDATITSPSRVLPSTSPDVYVVDAPELLGPIRSAVPRLVQQLTGASYFGQIYAVATRPMSPYRGIVVVVDDSLARCGRTQVGTPEGFIRLHPNCLSPARIRDDLFAHEFGHAMGFWHTDPHSTNQPGQNCLAGGRGWLGGVACNGGGGFTPREQYHARLAYRIGRDTPYCGWPLGKACYEQSSSRDAWIGPAFVVD